MTQEQKAKAYDIALDKIKMLLGTGSNFSREELEYIFPELKESYDERIRKAIRYAIGQSEHSDSTLINGVSSEEALAWFEKQGENNMGISESTKQKLEVNLNKALEKETPESCNEFLEKQGEQETFPLEQAANIFLDALSNSPYNNKPITDAQTITKQLLNFLQNPASYNPDALIAIEPKFKVGDTIHYKGENTTFPMIIEKISGGYYMCNEGKRVNIKFQDYYEIVKQTSTWSEEDKRNLLEVKCIIDEIWNSQYIRGELDYSAEELESLWHWLDDIWRRVEYPQENKTKKLM